MTSAIATATKTAGAVKGVATSVPTPSYGSDLTLPLVVGSVLIVGWSSVVSDTEINMKAILAGGVVAVGLSVIDNVNESMAEAFAGIIFLGICYKFLPTLVSKLGYSAGGSGNNVDHSAIGKQGRTEIQPSLYTGGAVAGGGTGTATPQRSGGNKSV